MNSEVIYLCAGLTALVSTVGNQLLCQYIRTVIIDLDRVRDLAFFTTMPRFFPPEYRLIRLILDGILSRLLRELPCLFLSTRAPAYSLVTQPVWAFSAVNVGLA